MMPRNAFKSRKRNRRRGSVMVYGFFLMVIMLAFISLGMDFGRMEEVKTEMQRTADACAHGGLQIYLTYGSSIATAYTPILGSQAYNPVDSKSGVNPTITVTWGSYNPATKTFTPGGTSPVAVKVTVCRTTATGNPMKLTFPLINGVGEVRTTCDVWATSIAYLAGGQSGSVNLPATANLYLSGMPAGSTTVGYGDNTSNSAPYQVASIPVTPGTFLTFTSLSGTSLIVPGTVPATGPAGNNTYIIHHGENYNGNPNPGYTNPENGIGDATMPADAMCGVFLNNNVPTSASAPAPVDWTKPAVSNLSSYTNLVNQQPFMIGNGQTTTGTTKTFLVPPGATRLFLSVWDGVEYSNNSGSLSGTVGVQQQIQIVQ